MTATTRLDRLSAILEGLAPRISVRETGETVAATRYPAGESTLLRLHLITRGEATLSIGNKRREPLAGSAVAVLRGDCDYVLSQGAEDCNAAAPCQLCVEARLEGPAAAILLEAFSEPLLVRLDGSTPELDLMTRLIAHEVSEPRCGHTALLARAGDILFIGLLRYLIAYPRTTVGLLNGLSNQHIARALVAMHAAPSLPWTLDALAREAGMSRTAFAVLFRQMMDRPPGRYLAQLRLAIARRLVDEGQGLKRAARETGYASTAALSRALGREAPGNRRQSQTPQADRDSIGRTAAA